MKPFRIATIHLDEDHDVAGITAVIDAPFLDSVRTLSEADVPVTRRERGNTELWVELDVTALLKLFQAVGSRLDANPLQVPGAYNALSLVVYGLMED
ncbi:hypothetical protein ACWKSP_22210 [Micromonosporaceae bacterium Da 78-11]